ncbi:MAG: hypothetical protein AAFP93_00500 [Bacteroidota bacterium]
MLRDIFYFFPVQLLLNHLKSNKVLLLFWLILFATVTNSINGFLALHHLFLDPEYLDHSSFLSFFILGIALGGFTMAFHATTYIIGIHKFAFVGALKRPFIVFCLNNSTIPLAFLGTYLAAIVRYQLMDEQNSMAVIFFKCAGLLVGIALSSALLLLYVVFMDKERPNTAPKGLLERLSNALVRRVNKIRRRLGSEKSSMPVKSYISFPFGIKPIKDLEGRYNRQVVLQIFYRSHLNLVVFEMVAVASFIVLGLLSPSPLSQIPAAASGVLFLTIVVMSFGFIAFWAKRWSNTAIMVLLFVLNMMTKNPWVLHTHESHALGLCYDGPPVEYSAKNIRAVNSPQCYAEDKTYTLQMLENWRKKFPKDKPPKLVVVCASGGGLFAALGTMQVLQEAERITQGKFMTHTMLMTCVSGGALGAAYFRELYLRQRQGKLVDLYNKAYLRKIAHNSLNAVVFHLIVNDLLVNAKRIQYNDKTYRGDRGFVLEEQIHKYTDAVLNKPIKAYKAPEFNSVIPMMILSTIINDGSKLYMSPHSVSYMTADLVEGKVAERENGTKGIDLMRFFEKQQAAHLRFTSALRMNATIPYALPVVVLPSRPAIEVVDAGLMDNHGVGDAITFLHVFKDWISDNTAGVVLVTIRGKQHESGMLKHTSNSLFYKLLKPINLLHRAWAHMQDIRNNVLVEQAPSWLAVPLTEIKFYYTGVSSSTHSADGDTSIGWYLTTRARKTIMESIHLPRNQASFLELKAVLQ